MSPSSLKISLWPSTMTTDRPSAWPFHQLITFWVSKVVQFVCLCSRLTLSKLLLISSVCHSCALLPCSFNIITRWLLCIWTMFKIHQLHHKSQVSTFYTNIHKTSQLLTLYSTQDRFTSVMISRAAQTCCTTQAPDWQWSQEHPLTAPAGSTIQTRPTSQFIAFQPSITPFLARLSNVRWPTVHFVAAIQTMKCQLPTIAPTPWSAWQPLIQSQAGMKVSLVWANGHQKTPKQITTCNCISSSN